MSLLDITINWKMCPICFLLSDPHFSIHFIKGDPFVLFPSPRPPSHLRADPSLDALHVYCWRGNWINAEISTL